MAQRLAALGDLTAATTVAGGSPAVAAVPVYDAALVDAVKRFQQRHGLKDDGIIGAATLRQLQVAPAARCAADRADAGAAALDAVAARAAHDRRQYPGLLFTCWNAYEVHEDGVAMRRTMKVIVGKSVDARTPFVRPGPSLIEFSPYWNVPATIARKGLVPRLRRDPAPTSARGRLRIRRRRRPCEEDHPHAGAARRRAGRPAAPAPAAGRAMRWATSSSCSTTTASTCTTRRPHPVRPRPARLQPRLHPPAGPGGRGPFSLVLEGQPEWTEERIGAAMAAGKSSTLRLTDPVRVVITYGTAIVRGRSDLFHDDIHGHDRLLDAALRRPSAVRSGPATRS
ncbi:MAG: peptidoglycan-binding protein [Betaproteobacteria bacterium]|nr:peptidoglycan-binding protein [Betaproteobacteria bacterium]